MEWNDWSGRDRSLPRHPTRRQSHSLGDTAMNNIDKQRFTNLQPEPDKVQPEPYKVQSTKVQPDPDKIQPDNTEHEVDKVQPANVEPEPNEVQPDNVQSDPNKAQRQSTLVQSGSENFQTLEPSLSMSTAMTHSNSDSHLEVRSDVAEATVAEKYAKELEHKKMLSVSDMTGDLLIGYKNAFSHINEEAEEFAPLPDGDPTMMASSLGDSACGAVESSPQGRYFRYPEKLGSGQYKDVYRAYDTQEGIEVAWNAVNLNNLPKQERLRIMNEVRLLQNLDHMNLVAFHGSWLNREAQQVVFVTEMLVNGSLKEFISKIHVIRWKVVKRWTRQILRGLEYLHSKDPPIIHRDLKCDNIFINGHTGDLRIGDLGLSTSSARTDKRMSVLGTPEFMAPEMYDETYNEKVDIYAFGMCLVEMITKERPYAECSNAAQIYKKVVYKKMFPAALEHIQNKRAHDFIKLCLNHSPDARPSASELLKHEFLVPNEVEDSKEVALSKSTFAPLLEEEAYELSTSAAPVVEAPAAAGMLNIDGNKSQAQATELPSTKSSVRLSTSSDEGGGGGANVEGKGMFVGSSIAHQRFYSETPGVSGSLALPTEPTFSKTIGPNSSSCSSATDFQVQPFDTVRRSVSVSSDIARSEGTSIHPRSTHSFSRENDITGNEKAEQLVQMLRAMPGNESQMRKVNLPEGRVERVEIPDLEKMPVGGFQQREPATTTELELGGDQQVISPRCLDSSNSQALGVRRSSTDAAAVISTEPKVSSSNVAATQPQMVRLSAQPPPGSSKRNSTMTLSEIIESAPPGDAPPPPTDVRERSATTDSSSSLKSGSLLVLHTNSNTNSKTSEEPCDCDTHVKYASSQGAEVDVLRLVMHAHMEGRLQEVEFDFHLEQDNDVEVAEEMIKELKLPETELNHISETIRSLAYKARALSMKKTPSYVSLGGTSSDVPPSEGGGDKEVGTAPSRSTQPPISLIGNTSSHGVGITSHNLETLEAPRQPKQQTQQHLSNMERKYNSHQPQGNGGSSIALGTAGGGGGGGQSTLSGGVTSQQQQSQVGLGGNLTPPDDQVTSYVHALDVDLLFDGEDEDIEVDAIFQKEREKHKKKVRTAQKAFEARQHKLVIAHNECVEENRRMQEKFKKTCEGFEQKKCMMVVEFRQRMSDFSKEWEELKQRAKGDREQRIVPQNTI